MEEKHKFKPLKIEKNGKKVQACQECGALKIGENTIVVDENYIDLAPLTSDPTLAEGRVWFRGDKEEKRWSPDGTIIEEFEVKHIYDYLNSIKGFVYLAEGTPTDSWKFTADPSTDVWIRQYSTDACFQPKYQYHGSYAHWTADNTFVDVPNKADNVYGDGEVLSVSQVPDGTIIDRWLSYPGPTGGPQDGAFDGEYLWIAHGKDTQTVYQYTRDGVEKGKLTFPHAVHGATWDGQYLWVCNGVPDPGWIYQYTTGGTQITAWQSKGPASGNPEGITWDGEYLWVSEHNLYCIYKFTPDGVLKQTIPDTPKRGEGLAWDGKYLWQNYNGKTAGAHGYTYRYKPDGTLVDTISVPGGIPEGGPWDGKYLWHSDEDSGYVYKIGASGSFDLNYSISPV